MLHVSNCSINLKKYGHNEPTQKCGAGRSLYVRVFVCVHRSFVDWPVEDFISISWRPPLWRWVCKAKSKPTWGSSIVFRISSLRHSARLCFYPFFVVVSRHISNAYLFQWRWNQIQHFQDISYVVLEFNTLCGLKGSKIPCSLEENPLLLLPLNNIILVLIFFDLVVYLLA